jgi:predicted DNA-binding transcriptional regulator YafY
VLLSEELKRFFLSYGNQIEVVSPENLRTALKNEIIDMAELYS